MLYKLLMLLQCLIESPRNISVEYLSIANIITAVYISQTGKNISLTSRNVLVVVMRWWSSYGGGCHVVVVVIWGWLSCGGCQVDNGPGGGGCWWLSMVVVVMW